MMVARNGHIWLRSNQHVVEMLPDGSRAYVRTLPGEQTSEAYPTLAEDGQGRILTSLGSELALWEKDHWRLVTDHNGLSPFEVQELFVDREGSIWMGVVGHGLLRWVGEDRWEGYTQADGLSDNLVWAMKRDHQGRLWIGTESGLDWIPAGGNAPKVWHSPGVHRSAHRIAGGDRGWSDLDGLHGRKPDQDRSKDAGWETTDDAGGVSAPVRRAASPVDRNGRAGFSSWIRAELIARRTR